MFKYILIYGLSLVGLLISIQFINYSLWLNRIDDNSYSALIALLFLVVGYFVARNLFKSKKTESLEILKTDDQILFNAELASNLNISKRELEVLELISKGYSNQEIAEELFISLNTVKTHISNLYLKLEVSNRTKAIAKAKEIRLLT